MTLTGSIGKSLLPVAGNSGAGSIAGGLVLGLIISGLVRLVLIGTGSGPPI